MENVPAAKKKKMVAKGDNGADGKSAYDLAVEKGFDGTEEEWLASLKGIAGEQGETGKSAFELAQENGFDGDLAAWLTSLHGEDGKDGEKGADGANGKSAFELYKESNPEYTGTLEEWLNKQIAQLYRYYLFIISHLLIRHPYKQYG